MKTTSRAKSVDAIIRRLKSEKINLTPDYQRGAVWNLQKKQLLIDTILRNYDLPKFYFRILENAEYEFEVADGQQRLRAIFEFFENEWALSEESRDIGDGTLSGCFYGELPTDMQDSLGDYEITICEIERASDIEIRDLFLRLQEGVSLKPPEKRNAMVGDLRDFIADLSKSRIYLKTNMRNDRFQYDDLAAHVTCLQLNGGPTEVKAANLKSMYQQHKVFNSAGTEASKIKKVHNYLDKVFEERTPELSVKWGFVDLYWLTSQLLDNYDMSSRHDDVRNFYLSFEQERRLEREDLAELTATGSALDRDLYDYINAFQREGATRTNLEVRASVYMRRFLNQFPDLMAKDQTRNFSQDERIVLWRRANQKCQELSCGKAITLDEMHADHKEPHSRGGATTIANGQALCSACNLAKGSS